MVKTFLEVFGMFACSFGRLLDDRFQTVHHRIYDIGVYNRVCLSGSIVLTYKVYLYYLNIV